MNYSPQREPAGESLCLNGSDWWLRQTMAENGYISCTVPGSVQTALMENELVPMPPYFGSNIRAMESATVGKQSWLFKKFDVPAEWRGKLVRLRFEAVDYKANFYLNDQWLGTHEGHFSPVSFDVSNILQFDGNNVLAVQFPEGEHVVTHEMLLPNPQLWWPNGSGAQNLYQAEVTILDGQGRRLDKYATTFGIRKLEMVKNEGHADSQYPWTFVINGQKIYGKGGNWVLMDSFHRMDSVRYERLLLQAREANFNIIRWWGGERRVMVQAVNPAKPDWRPDFGELTVKAWNSVLVGCDK